MRKFELGPANKPQDRHIDSHACAGVEAAQIALAWILRRMGTIAIPKAQSGESQWQNLLAAQIALDDEDLRAMDQRYVEPAFAPDWSAAVYREPEMN